MAKLFQLAARNLTRYRRRTVLTSLLIIIGVAAVLLFVAISGSFKQMMIGQITDSMLGHMQVHRRGYVASIESLPLNLNLPPSLVGRIKQALDKEPAIAATAPRVKFGAMFSNFTETTSMRVNGVDPDREIATTPLLPGRLIGEKKAGPLLKSGEVLIPELIARGMKVKAGDTVVLVATNRDGSVNGKTFTVGGVLQSASGPSGKDGYIHIDDARSLLRTKEAEVSEIAIRLRHPAQLDAVYAQLRKELPAGADAGGLEVHTWADLSPFSSIVRMLDLLAVFIKIMMVSIVLISVMNVMVMAVYERIREIGTISAIGTPPRRILSLFLTEGLLLGLGGAALGTAISLAAIYALNIWKVSVRFGMQQEAIRLSPAVSAMDIVTIVAMVIAMALLASLQPAWKASRMDPVSALGHV